MFAGGGKTRERKAAIMSSFNVNRVVLVGRLTRDPELRALPSGTSVCSLRLACNSSRRDADGTYVERPNYFDVSVYGAAADTVGRYMSKGRRMALDGRLEWREWETDDDQKRQAVSIVAETVQFLDAPGDRAAAGGNWDGGNEGDGDSDSEDAELVGVGAAGEEEPGF
jgi:single-strand DNA-binding protein